MQISSLLSFLLLIIPQLSAGTNLSHVNAQTSEMEYVDICDRAGECKKFSRLVMGTDHLVQGNWTGEGQPELTEEQAFKVLDEGAKHGINFFDTSPIYVGGVENKLGRWKSSRAPMILADEFYYEPGLNPDRKLYVLSKGGFPFDLFWAKQLEPGTHSAELMTELQNLGVIGPHAFISENMPIPLRNVPAGTYASRLYGSQDQITTRISEELGHTLSNLNGDITIYLMHRDDGDAVNFKAIERPQTFVKTIMQAIGANIMADQLWMLGWSNWQTDRVVESIKLAERSEEHTSE